MKGNSFLIGLASFLAVLSAGVAFLAYQYVQLTRVLNQSQNTIAQVELRQNRLKMLVNEAREYSRRDPSINPILETIGARLPPATPANPTGHP